MDPLASEKNQNIHYPAAMVNITNSCNLKCEHCFVFRDGNANLVQNQEDDKNLIDQLIGLQKKHGIHTMLWMGGEPLIKKELLKKGLPYFEHNTITTNGTLPLVDYSQYTKSLLYVISLDGPEHVNDELRGRGVFQRVLKTLSNIPENFPHKIQCQCVVTKKNQHLLAELVDSLKNTKFDHMTFSFYVPPKNDDSGNCWLDLKDRDGAVKIILDLKANSNGFIKNRTTSLEMMLSENNPKKITDHCPAKKAVLPLYLDKGEFVTPFCCYGNDVNCDQCGAWVVFEFAARKASEMWQSDPWYYED